METMILKLPEFEGPIELLWALVQKNEVDICNLGLKRLLEQISSIVDQEFDHLDLGAESIGHAGNLLWVKSRALLPKNEMEEFLGEEPADTQKSLLQKLVEYCRFKEASLHLSLREEKAKESFFRPTPLVDGMKRNLGIEHVSLEELAAVFQIVFEKAKETRGVIEEEEWRVSDKMQEITTELKVKGRIPLESCFRLEYSKLEIIVLFLAILELMKLNEIRVIRDETTQSLVITDYDKRN